MIDSILEEYRKQIVQENKNYNRAVNTKNISIRFISITFVYLILSIIIKKIPIINYKTKSISAIILLLLFLFAFIRTLIIMNKNMRESNYNINEQKLKILKSLLKKKHLYTKRRMTDLLSILDKQYPSVKFKPSTFLSSSVFSIVSFILILVKKLYKYLNEDLKLSNYQIFVVAFFTLIAIYLIVILIVCVYQFFVSRKPYINRLKSDLQYLIITIN